MAEASINDIKRGYYSAALGYTLGQAMTKSLSDLEYAFFSQAPPATPATLSQAQAEAPANATAGLVSGQRLAQSVTANLKAITGYGASKTLKVNAAGTGFEWVS